MKNIGFNARQERREREMRPLTKPFPLLLFPHHCLNVVSVSRFRFRKCNSPHIPSCCQFVQTDLSSSLICATMLGSRVFFNSWWNHSCLQSSSLHFANKLHSIVIIKSDFANLELFFNIFLTFVIILQF